MNGSGYDTVAVNDDVLFDITGSVTAEVTLAVSTMLPTVSACTGMLIAVVCPAASVPTLQVMVWPLTVQLPKLVVMLDWHGPRLQYRLLTARPAGNVSVTT